MTSQRRASTAIVCCTYCRPGPATRHTHATHVPLTTAGPKERVGLMEQPSTGSSTACPRSTVAPIASGAKPFWPTLRQVGGAAEGSSGLVGASAARQQRARAAWRSLASLVTATTAVPSHSQVHSCPPPAPLIPLRIPPPPPPPPLALALTCECQRRSCARCNRGTRSSPAWGWVGRWVGGRVAGWCVSRARPWRGRCGSVRQ